MTLNLPQFMDNAIATPRRRLFWWIAILGLFILLGLLLSSEPASATTLTGTVKVNGTPFTGTMTFQLNYPATSGSYITMPAQTAPIPIQNGQFASLNIDGNDALLPRGTYYAFRFYDPYGQLLTRLNYVVTGSTYDLGSAIPTPIQTNNVNFLDLLGIRNFSAVNATFSNQICISTGACISTTGISNAESVNGILFSQSYNQQNPGSTTCGVQEAEAALPSAGGIIILQPGNCNVSQTIVLAKPTALIGFGQGGTTNSSFSSYVNPTTLTQTSATTAVIQILATSATDTSGYYLSGFALIGNSSGIDISAAVSGDTVHDVVIDGVTARAMNGVGLDVIGSVNGLIVTNSHFDTNTFGGIRIGNGLNSQYTIDNVVLSKSSASRNSGPGILITSPAVFRVTVDQFTSVSNTGDGLQVSSSASSASLSTYQSTYSLNTGNGILLAGGSGHIVESSSFLSGGIQQYGVHVTSSGVANSQTLSIKDNTFAANTLVDVFAGSGVPYVLAYPQIAQSSATYPFSAFSISSGVATLTVSGNTTISGGDAITVSSGSGFSGCSNFNGPHTALSASSSSVTFSTTCTGSGGAGFVGGGSMTIGQATPGTIHYIVTNTSQVALQFIILASSTATSCALASDGSGKPSEWNCTGTFTWASNLGTSTYRPLCSLTYPPSGFANADASSTNFYIQGALSPTSFNYLLASDHSNAVGATFTLNCIATQ